MYDVEEVPKNTVISLREASQCQSKVGGQGFKKCSCQASKTQCRTNQCTCFRAKLQCNSRCQSKTTCANKEKILILKKTFAVLCIYLQYIIYIILFFVLC